MSEDNLLKKFDENLDVDWRDSTQSKDSQELKLMLADVAKAEEENQKNKEEDMDLQSAKETYDTAKVQYSEATKANRLKTKFLLWVLKNRGE